MVDHENEQKINDLDDLEDRLDVLEAVVEDLKKPSIPIPSLKIVTNIQHMNQYIVLEDSIIQGIETLNKKLASEREKERFHECAKKFNTLAADYQDTWTNEYWSTYDLVRGGYKIVTTKQNDKTKTSNEITKEVSDLQDLAITMNRKSHQEADDSGDTALREIDELARQYDSSTLVKPSHAEEEPKKKGCCAKCLIF